MVLNRGVINKTFEETDERTRVTQVSLINCRIEVVDRAGKVFTKRFPLPKKTRKALNVISGFLDYMGNEVDVEKVTVDFSNVPQETVEYIKKVDGLSLSRDLLLGKLPPLGLPFIVKVLRKKPNVTVKVNGYAVQK